MEQIEKFSKVTLGPWTLDGNGVIEAELEDGTGVTIAKCAESYVLDDATVRANARLICAAPQMLAALRLIRMLPGFEVDEPYGQDVIKAIALATGYGTMLSTEIKIEAADDGEEDGNVVCMYCDHRFWDKDPESTICPACAVEAADFNSDLSKDR